MVPHGAGAQNTTQVTPRLLRSLLTVPVSWIAALACTTAVVGATTSVIAGSVPVGDPCSPPQAPNQRPPAHSSGERSGTLHERSVPLASPLSLVANVVPLPSLLFFSYRISFRWAPLCP